MGDRTVSRDRSSSYWHGCGLDSVCDRTGAHGSSVEWIAHRLPKEDELNEWGEVLITNSNGWVEVAEWTGSQFRINKQYVTAEYVKAWAKMPQPYGGKR